MSLQDSLMPLPPILGAAADPGEDQPVDWQLAMKRAIRCSNELLDRVGLPLESGHTAAEEPSFPTFVPLELLSRIRPGDRSDPILKQVLATSDELVEAEGFVSDPVGDLKAEKVGGLLQKYKGRGLIVTHGACAVHCRYCFRREFPYSEHGSIRQRWKPALEELANDPSITEVLLSGGDPLTLTDTVLSRLISGIEQIPHIRRLRIHTRLPVVIPQRVTEELVGRLRQSRLAVWMVVHLNHAQEIDGAVTQAFSRLIDAGLPVLNQSVLLAGVNDTADALEELSHALIDRRVQPYYLHQLDRVRGASHFWVSEQHGRALIAELRERLPGYAVPKYVVEQAGHKSKTPIA